MIDEVAWCEATARWREAVQPLVDARGLKSAEDLEMDDLMALAHGVLPDADPWEALYADYADDIEALR